MPNHVQNRLQIKGSPEDVKAVFDSIKGVENKIDFNKIITMAESLHVEDSNTGKIGQHVLYGDSDISWLGDVEIHRRFVAYTEEQKEEAKEIGKIYQDNLEKYGYPTWHGWALHFWGTKWNAYGSPDKRDTEDTIFFETAWSGVPELMETLSTKFPNVELVYAYADEDTGTNTGSGTIQNGELSMSSLYAGSREAYELAFELHPGEALRYKLVDGNYQYIEEGGDI